MPTGDLRTKILKTQVRFGELDLEVLIKRKGEGGPYRRIDMAEFLGRDTIPEFDNKVTWRRQLDKPPRRRVQSSSDDSSTEQPAKRKERNKEPAMTRRSKYTNVNNRARSQEETEVSMEISDGEIEERNTEDLDNTEVPAEQTDPLETTQ